MVSLPASSHVGRPAGRCTHTTNRPIQAGWLQVIAAHRIRNLDGNDQWRGFGKPRAGNLAPRRTCRGNAEEQQHQRACIYRTDTGPRIGIDGKCVTQVLEGGMDGIVCCAQEQSVEIGREDCDINFPNDVFLSPRHAKVEMTGEALKLIDENSQNGTYVRIRGERELGHGDYLFLGKNLLRVEVTA